MATIPTIEIRQGDRHLIVNACDLSTWEAAGWREAEAPAPSPPQEPDTKAPKGSKRKQ